MRIYSTLSRELEELPAPPGPIRMYFCGPTVYQRAHIGNARPFVVGMWLRSWLRARGYDAKLVHNITDVNDKIYRADVLAWAYARCRDNRGVAGVDGQTFEVIERYGRERWLGELAEGLRTKTYRPQAVRRVWIPKPDGKQRPLGIPTVRDRVVQAAAIFRSRISSCCRA